MRDCFLLIYALLGHKLIALIYRLAQPRQPLHCLIAAAIQDPSLSALAKPADHTTVSVGVRQNQYRGCRSFSRRARHNCERDTWGAGNRVIDWSARCVPPSFVNSTQAANEVRRLYPVYDTAGRVPHHSAHTLPSAAPSLHPDTTRTRTSRHLFFPSHETQCFCD